MGQPWRIRHLDEVLGHITPLRFPNVATTCSVVRSSNDRSSSSRRSADANARRARCAAYPAAVLPPTRANAA
jgi:hypothetical protein